jgi:uncharacterized protein YdeI (YjbR/CyaY-like superfamily)
MDKVPQFYAKDRKTWRAWLEKNHNTETGVWLIFDKGSNQTMAWEDIVQEALCFGWIDSRPGKVSDTQSKIYVSRRKPKSVWSKINKQHVEKLIDNGLMTSAGLSTIETAKSSGSWSALNLSDNLVYPPELKVLFKNFPRAKQHFESFPVGSQRNTLQWIYDAKTKTTRSKRIEQTVDAAKENKRLR